MECPGGRIDKDELAILEAFEGPVSPEYGFAIQALGHLSGRRILNPGCGAGEEAVYLAQKGAKVDAVDLSPGMIKVSRKLTQKYNLTKDITCTVSNVEELPFDSDSFDAVFGSSIIHHVNVEGCLKEFYRVLKPKGTAVFIEPLFYNPVINLYRKMANIVRTPSEHPLKMTDIQLFHKYFNTVQHYEFHLFTLLIFVYFFLIEGVHPNKDRYWKKIIRDAKKYARMFKILYNLDRIFLRAFPFIRRYCWVTVVVAKKR